MPTRTQVGQPDMFSGALEIHEYEDREQFETAGFRVTPERVLHYSMLAFGFRASANGSVLAYSGDSGPSDALPALAADADLFLCEATLAKEETDLRGHLTADEAVAAFRDSGARRLVVIHRPHELALDETLERAYDGWQTNI